MPINPQSQRQTYAENDSDFEIVDKDEVDPIAKEMLEKKLERAAKAYRSNLERII